MTKKELIDRLVVERGLTVSEAQTFVNVFFNTLLMYLREHQKIYFPGFGTFYLEQSSLNDSVKVRFEPAPILLRRLERAVYLRKVKYKKGFDRYKQFLAWLEQQQDDTVE